MNYYIKETYSQNQTAGSKARDDISEMLNRLHYRVINIDGDEDTRERLSFFKKIEYHSKISKRWEKIFSSLKKDDRVVIQFPVINHSIYLYRVFQKLKKRGVISVAIIHDMEMFRKARKKKTKLLENFRISFEEKALLNNFSYVISHNPQMTRILREEKIKTSIVNLEIFDYLSPEIPYKETRKIDPIIIAGNLSNKKSPYIYHLPENVDFRLYGPNYTEAEKNSNVTYMGSFPADEVPQKIFGSFGLIWDGSSSKTCEGVYGQYLKINNPHKTSLYLASGLPVIIWKQAALAKFVEDHHCGITVNSLDEIHDRISKMSDEEYTQLKENANKIGKKLREGYFTKKALSQCFDV